MKIALFCHSLASCWNHGNAHFLRGIARELTRRGHAVRSLENVFAWSRLNLVRDHGSQALAAWRGAYPELGTTTYEGLPDLDAVLDGADLVLVHEWTEPELVRAIGRHRLRGGRYRLLFHDTHHRAASEPESVARACLDGYDGVLAFGEALRQRWLEQGWAKRVWVWHEAADLELFRPLPGAAPERDLVWVGNWGDGERSVELGEFLIEPVRELGLEALVHGVRYPPEGLHALASARIRYGGWLPNHRVPAAFAAARMTVHVPRRPYVERLPGIPTIRVFEALACGIPLISAPWRDNENLFGEGCFLFARDGEEMRRRMRDVLSDADLRRALTSRGLEVVQARHSCAHRVGELLSIVDALGAAPTAAVRSAA